METFSVYIFIVCITLSAFAGELDSATKNIKSASTTLLAHLITDELKENGFIFLNDSLIGNNIRINKETNNISGLERLSDLVSNISTFYYNEDILNQTETSLFSYTLGNVAGRKQVAPGISRVSGAPKHVLVTVHSEASYLPHSPLYLIFSCPGVPDISSGGQTIVSSIEKIFTKLMQSKLGRSLLNDVAKYGVIYIRNDVDENNQKYAAIWKNIKYPTWQKRFIGRNKSEIIDLLTSNNQNGTWISDKNGGYTLQSRWHMPGFRLHPITNKMVWFNQLYGMNGRYFNLYLVDGMNKINLSDRPLNTLIGNGRALSDEEYLLLDNIHNELAILIPWDNKGDILAIDNFVYQHGRTPYNSYRSCVINWGKAVQGGKYIYNPKDFVQKIDAQDIIVIYKLLDKFKWYDTIYEYVIYRDTNDIILSAEYDYNSEDISFNNNINNIPQIYKEILSYRKDINVLLHVSNPDVSAIAMSQYSFLAIDQSYYMLYPVQKMKEFNISNVGIETKLLLLKNNGMIVFGTSIDETFTRLFYAIRAAQAQVFALQYNINDIIFPSQEIQQITINQALNFNPINGYGYLEFMAWKRRYNLLHDEKEKEKDKIIFSVDEYNLRKDMVRAYLILDRLGWTETIYQHITGVLSNHSNVNEMFINAYGLEFGEVSINNLMKVRMNGSVIDGGNSVRSGQINPSGLALHATIHTARPLDAQIVIHCHHPIISAISVYKYGLLSSSINEKYKQLIGEIAYHSFDSLSLAINKTRLANELANGSNVIILGNHGIVTIGKNVKDAFNRLYYTIQAAKIQIKTINQQRIKSSVCQVNNNNENAYYDAWSRF